MRFVCVKSVFQNVKLCVLQDKKRCSHSCTVQPHSRVRRSTCGRGPDNMTLCTVGAEIPRDPPHAYTQTNDRDEATCVWDWLPCRLTRGQTESKGAWPDGVVGASSSPCALSHLPVCGSALPDLFACSVLAVCALNSYIVILIYYLSHCTQHLENF